MRNTILAALTLAVLALAGRDALAEYRPLCPSAAGYCTHTGPDAPILRADVCWNGTTATLKSGSCPTGTNPYHLTYGDVDAITGQVNGYIPHDDACSVSGICLEFTPHQGGWESPICCNGGGCWPGTECAGTIYYCWDGVSNEDGSVTCFESEEI